MLPLFLTTGILGGFTTFSAFSLDTALLWERGQAVRAALYALGNVVPAVVAVFLGLAVMRGLFR
jgi:CrcB protein